MILINLLPPELRRRQGGVSPMFMSVVAGGGSCLVLLLLWLYIILVRIPNADRLITDKTTELAEKTIKADEVLKIEAKIQEAKDRYKQIVGLMLQKVYWARTFDEFVTLLNGPFTVQGFDVRCQELSVSEAAAVPGIRRDPSQGSQVAFKVNWRYKLMGNERPLAGDYIKSFFETINTSPFWKDNGFEGKPVDSYRGDVPRMNSNINRVIIEGQLDWSRIKVVQEQTARK